MKNTSGFTLVELMVVIAVIGIVATIAAPSFGQLIDRQRLDLTARDLAFYFSEARGQAVGLRKDITIKFECTNASTKSCSNTSTQYVWHSPRKEIQLVSDPIDVTFTKEGLAKQRTKKIPNPDYIEGETSDNNAVPPKNPKEIEEIVPLVFSLCNSELNESRIISVPKTGSVESVVKGIC